MTEYPCADRDNGEFRHASGLLATGVSVVSTAGPAGSGGQTVSAMSVASYDPAMLLVCVNRRSPINDLVRANGTFCVNALAAHHSPVADSFAGRPRPGYAAWDFSCGEWDTGGARSPRLLDAVAVFDCVVAQIVPAGSHFVYLGAVSSTRHRTNPPLAYTGHRYHRLAVLTERTSA